MPAITVLEVVARDSIELPTRGFSVRSSKPSNHLIAERFRSANGGIKPLVTSEVTPANSTG